MLPDIRDRWFRRSGDSAILSCGAHGQNRPTVAALLECIDQRLPIHASQGGGGGISAAGFPDADGRPLLYCQSSGSTGGARTIRRSQASWIASFEVNHARYGIGTTDRYAVLGSLGHSLSLYGIVEALHLGADLLALGGDLPRAQLATLRETRASVLYATPSQLGLLQRAGTEPLPDIRHVFCGGGALGGDGRAAAAALFPNAGIYEFYGASETSFVTISDSDTPSGSVGRAYPGVTLKLQPVAGNDAEIWVNSPYLFDGYEGEGSGDTRRDGDFLTVGEIGWLDEQGNLFLRGRRSRMVTVADVNVFLEDIERVMTGDCAGRACAAIAVPDALRGHAVIGFVEGAADKALAEKMKFRCRTSLGPFAAPRRIGFLDPMPMLPSGKPDLAALQRIAGAG
ncbi:AMP-binding protein [Paracoccus methylarcula]|uniref:AMP-binding protein n=1 Tax=Paracoccus methylarcula TaxID=72022 RepID=UPI001FE5096A|nr:AMP-binding protein [Paracoccus methylarcula]